VPSQHLQTLSEHVDVLEMNEAFEEVDGSFGFAGTCCVPNWRRLAPSVLKARYLSPSEIKVDLTSQQQRPNPSLRLQPFVPVWFYTCTRSPTP
jgi:hypothetical protein